MKDKIHFWNKIATKYALKPVPDQAIYEEMLSITRSHLKQDMELLEIGCGTGTTALHHAPFVKKINAIDFSENMIAIALKKARDQNIENVDFECCSIDDMPYTSASFDLIMAHSILHLLENKESVIQHIINLLKPGGLFISNTVCIEDFFKLFKFISPVAYQFGVFPYAKAFTNRQLITAHVGVGFEIIFEWRPDNKNLFLIAHKPA